MRRRDFAAGLLIAVATKSIRARERSKQIAIIISAGLARIDDPRDRTFWGILGGAAPLG
jgi:hypothetical protein